MQTTVQTTKTKTQTEIIDTDFLVGSFLTELEGDRKAIERAYNELSGDGGFGTLTFRGLHVETSEGGYSYAWAKISFPVNMAKYAAKEIFSLGRQFEDLKEQYRLENSPKL